MNSLDRSSVLYHADEFSLEEYSQSNVAVLPVIADDSFDEYARSELDKSLSESIAEIYSSTELIPADDMEKFISSSGYTHELSEMARDYEKVSIIDGEVLNKIAEDVNVRYIVWFYVQSSGFSFADEDPFKGSYGSGLNCFLWDAQKKKCVWEGKETFPIYSELRDRESQKIEIDLVSDNLAKHLGKSRTCIVEEYEKENVVKDDGINPDLLLLFSAVTIVIAILASVG